MDCHWDRSLWNPTRVNDNDHEEVEQYIQYNPGCQKPRRTVVDALAETLSRLTKSLQSHPYNPSLWLARGQCLLKLQYPELAIGDAYKGLQLVVESQSLNARLCKSVQLEIAEQLFGGSNCTHQLLPSEMLCSNIGKSKVQVHLLEIEYSGLVLLAQALLLANSINECLQIIHRSTSRFPECPELAAIRRVCKSITTREKTNLELNGLTAQEIEEEMEEIGCSGDISNQSYPWVCADLLHRTPNTIQAVNENIKRASKGKCSLRISSIRDKLRTANTVEQSTDVYGIFGEVEIAKGHQILKDYTCMCASDTIAGRCYACCDNLPAAPVSRSCCKEKYCSQSCLQRATSFYHGAVCGKDLSTYEDGVEMSTLSTEIVTEGRLLLRSLAIALNFADLHPLQAPIISRLTSSNSDETCAFSLKTNIVLPINILERLGVDIYANHNFDTWVIQTIQARIRNNYRDTYTESDGRLYISLNPLYSFFNHSCCPNVSYDAEKCVSSSTLRMKTIRKTKAGEELFITYLHPDELDLSRAERQEKLKFWMGGECQCSRCKREEREERELLEESDDSDVSEWGQ